jgi:glyoxylase-like metal-dependent hydrolase (beta-lactamase superfamily II)
VGWNLIDGQPSFPNARYILSETDWNAFQDPAVQGAFPFQYVDQTLTPLKALGMVDLINGETALSDEITAVPAPGHTLGHMVINISSRGQRAMILGDVLMHPAQVSEPEWGSIFDMDRDQAIATRKKLLGRLEMEAMTAAQCHLPQPGFGLVVRTEGRRHWQPLERT